MMSVETAGSTNHLAVKNDALKKKLKNLKEHNLKQREVILKLTASLKSAMALNRHIG